MASGPITPWQIEEEKVEVVTDFLFLGSKITADSDCSHEIRKRLFLVGKAMTTLDCVERRRYSPSKGRVVFPVATDSCESWTIKKVQRQRVDAFRLWCWRRLLRVPWTPERSKQSILREINPDYSLEELMLELKLQYFGNLM